LNANTWFAAGKDHEISAPAAITACAIALHDPNDEWDVHIKAEPSNPAPHPQAIAVLPAGYVLTGGGAFVNWHGAGNLLTASFPTSDTSWEVRSKDHDISDPSQITAYAIGIRPKHNGKKLRHEIRREKGTLAAHPTAHVQLDSGWSLSEGGALVIGTVPAICSPPRFRRVRAGSRSARTTRSPRRRRSLPTRSVFGRVEFADRPFPGRVNFA
jgi:hypothetical protein